MINIAYDPQIFSGQVYGGISRYICEIAGNIARHKDANVKIAAPMYVNAYLEHLPNEMVYGFKTPLPPNFLTSVQRASSLVLGDIILRRVMPDIIHETYYFKYPLGPKGPKRVLTVHDMIHEKFVSEFKYGKKIIEHKRVACDRADHIICVSESTKRDLIEILGIAPQKITVIYLGFNLMTSGKVSSNSEKISNKPYLLFVGSRGGYKNFGLMLEAFATSQILKSEFDLVCFGGGEFNIKELELIRRLGLSDGKVTQCAGNDFLLAKLYKKASAFVFPSIYEGFGIPPLEAMSYDCPVVCSNSSSIPEVVGDAGKFFDPYDVNSIKTAIESVVESIDIQRSLVESGRKRLSKFSWDKCATDTLNVYSTLV